MQAFDRNFPIPIRIFVQCVLAYFLSPRLHVQRKKVENFIVHHRTAADAICFNILDIPNAKQVYYYQIEFVDCVAAFGDYTVHYIEISFRVRST